MGKKKKSNNKTLDVRVTTDAFENINEIMRYIAIVNKQPLNAIKMVTCFSRQLTGLHKIHLLSENVN
jgi:hypothetical protein